MFTLLTRNSLRDLTRYKSEGATARGVAALSARRFSSPTLSSLICYALLYFLSYFYGVRRDCLCAPPRVAHTSERGHSEDLPRCSYVNAAFTDS